MRLLILAPLATLLSGCVDLPNEVAICAGTKPLRVEHARGLLTDGGPESQRTGERLLTGLKAGCNE